MLYFPALPNLFAMMIFNEVARSVKSFRRMLPDPNPTTTTILNLIRLLVNIDYVERVTRPGCPTYPVEFSIPLYFCTITFRTLTLANIVAKILLEACYFYGGHIPIYARSQLTSVLEDYHKDTAFAVEVYIMAAYFLSLICLHLFIYIELRLREKWISDLKNQTEADSEKAETRDVTQVHGNRMHQLRITRWKVNSALLFAFIWVC
ncbi:hypothetical protein BJ508DRAFT_334125 [Ascobolus immersus RN42]|uniref:Uncharacterized protein n=1 Tax=Ascobolus immersus RN42 TaxID=1160509 RepID=A0A3N4HH54_ASCIM|nr:hypothetical protein BJ508DRAFT_334125 [Ascobolus immersus RN42]